jgi:hypothetical protein
MVSTGMGHGMIRINCTVVLEKYPASSCSVEEKGILDFTKDGKYFGQFCNY